MPEPLRVSRVTIRGPDGTLIHDADITLAPARVTGFIGPSGAGKTILSRALLGTTRVDPGFESGELHWTSADGTAFRRTLRGRGLKVPDPNLHGTVVSTLPQHARYALDPLLPVGRLVGDITRRWRHDDDPTPWLAAAGLNATPSVLRRLPHELSGGMATRVALAQVLARGSRFLVADEPFTGLDPVASDQVEAALRRAADQGVGILLVTHDIRRIRGDVDGMHVIENGRIVEAHDPPWNYDNVQSEAARRLARATARDREAQP